jgi:hypothetical protein
MQEEDKMSAAAAAALINEKEFSWREKTSDSRDLNDRLNYTPEDVNNSLTETLRFVYENKESLYPLLDVFRQTNVLFDRSVLSRLIPYAKKVISDANKSAANVMGRSQPRQPRWQKYGGATRLPPLSNMILPNNLPDLPNIFERKVVLPPISFHGITDDDIAKFETKINTDNNSMDIISRAPNPFSFIPLVGLVIGLFLTAVCTLTNYNSHIFDYSLTLGVYNCNHSRIQPQIFNNKGLVIRWDSPITNKVITIPEGGDAETLMNKYGGINFSNLNVIFNGTVALNVLKSDNKLKNICVLFVHTPTSVGVIHRSMGIQIILYWKESITGPIIDLISDPIRIDGQNLMFFGYPELDDNGAIDITRNKEIQNVGNFLNLDSTGGARNGKNAKRRGSGSKRGKPVAVARRPVKWVSTGERVTLHDGKVRTLYRNERTGKVCVKKMVLRAGKRVAVYKTV